jgi:hypothetical protein
MLEIRDETTCRAFSSIVAAPGHDGPDALVGSARASAVRLGHAMI